MNAAFDAQLWNGLFTVVTTVFFKATVVVGVAGLVTLALRKSSAAIRYAVWSAALVVLLAIPFLRVAVPTWGFELEPPAIMPMAMTTSSPSVPAFDANGAVDSPMATPTSVVDAGSHTQLGAVAIFGLAVWLAVAALMLLRLVLHTVHVSRITKRASPPEIPWIGEVTRRLTKALGIRRPIRVVVSDEVAVPSSWGIAPPTVLLPRATSGLSRDRLETVLLHELAHIARRDYPVHLVVETVKALYWPNPLVWLAARRTAIERERACDDVAVTTGMRSEVYAAHLLDVARSSLGFAPQAVAIAMARRSGLAERVRSLLAMGVNRSPISVGRTIMVFGLALFAALPVAAFEMWRQAPRLTVEELIEQLEGGDPRVRRTAAWELGEREDPRAVPALLTQLRTGTTELRVVSAWALGEIKDLRAIDGLAVAMRDDEVLVREMAALALGELEAPLAVSELEAAFDRDPQIQHAIVWALGEIDSEDAWDAMNRAARQLDLPVGMHDEVWSGELERDPDVPVSRNATQLIEQLGSSDAEARRMAAWNLGLLGERRAVEALLDALGDPDESVRAMAVWALDEINPSRTSGS